MSKRAKKEKMFSKTLFVAIVALAAMISYADAKYYNIVSWAHWGDGYGADSECEANFASECAGMVDKPVAEWLQLVGDYIEIIDIQKFYSQKHDNYADCWCRTAIYYSTDNATYVQGEHGKPPGSSEATVTSGGSVLLPSLTMAFVLAIVNMY